MAELPQHIEGRPHPLFGAFSVLLTFFDVFDPDFCSMFVVIFDVFDAFPIRFVDCCVFVLVTFWMISARCVFFICVFWVAFDCCVFFPDLVQ